MAEGYERDAGIEASGGARDAAARARDVAGSTKRDLLDRAVEQKDHLKQRVAGMADDRRLQAADRADSITRALQGAADSLRESGETQLSSWVSQAAGQVERVVGYMHGKPADGMLHDFEDLARRNPALFLGGTYLAGMAVGRFLRASSPEPQRGDAVLPSDRALLDGSTGTYAEGSFAEGGTGSLGRTSFGADGLGDSGSASSTDTPWTGAGIGPSVGGTSDDGFGTGASDRGSYRGTSEAGDGEPGLTDEDLREAWHERDARRGTDSGYGASSVSREDAIDTGELTRYTNGDASESPNDDLDDMSDSRRGV